MRMRDIIGQIQRKTRIKVRSQKSELRTTFANSCHQALITAHYSVYMQNDTNEATAIQIAQLAVQHADALMIALGESDES